MPCLHYNINQNYLIALTARDTSDLALVSEAEFYYKPYKSEKDAFYVQVSRYNEGELPFTRGRTVTRFSLKISKAYLAMQGTLFPDKTLPRLIPEPNTRLYFGESPCTLSQYSQFVEQDDNCFSPAWKTSDYSSNIQLMPRKVDFTRYFLQADDNHAHEKKPAVSTVEVIITDDETINTTCKSLKPFDNIDELLYQFYINLDSDCLFTTPLAELEKAWDIKIDSQERIDAGQYDINDFYKKPYKSEKDAFYVKASRGEKDIHPILNLKSQKNITKNM